MPLRPCSCSVLCTLLFVKISRAALEDGGNKAEQNDRAKTRNCQRHNNATVPLHPCIVRCDLFTIRQSFGRVAPRPANDQADWKEEKRKNIVTQDVGGCFFFRLRTVLVPCRFHSICFLYAFGVAP